MKFQILMKKEKFWNKDEFHSFKPFHREVKKNQNQVTLIQNTMKIYFDSMLIEYPLRAQALQWWQLLIQKHLMK